MDDIQREVYDSLCNISENDKITFEDLKLNNRKLGDYLTDSKKIKDFIKSIKFRFDIKIDENFYRNNNNFRRFCLMIHILINNDYEWLN